METAASSPPASPAPVAKPLSVGDVVGRSFSLWIGNFVPFSIVTLVVNVPVLVFAGIAPDEGVGWRLLANFVSTLADLVVTGALTYGVLQALRGNRVTLRTLFETGFAKLGRVFLVSLGVGVRVFLGLVLLVVPGIVLFCRLYVAIPAAVVEEDATDAFDRSRALTDGSRWAILAVATIAFLVTAIVGAVAGVVVVLGASALPSAAVVLATALAALASPFGACTAAVAYHDLRLAKEGVDTADLAKVFG